MEIIKSIAIQSPTIIASLVFVIAAALKAGKERGSILILSGAIGLCLLTFASPFIYSGLMHNLIEGTGIGSIENTFMVIGLITRIWSACSIALVSIGTFLRTPAAPKPVDNSSV
jgi:hypothetical protein